MGKFCTKCGKPLAEGEICTCQATDNVQAMSDIQMEASQEQPQYQTQYQQEQPQYQQQAKQSYQQTQQAVANHMSKAVGTFINMITQPITTGRQLVASNEIGVAVTFIILQAIMSGFFALAVMAKIGGTAESVIGLLVGSYMDSSLKFPYGRIFILTVIASAMLSFLLALLLVAGNMMIKNTVTYGQMLNCAAVRSVWISVMSLIALILFILSPAAGICIYLLSGVWGVIAVTMVVPKNGECSADKFSMVLFGVTIVFGLLTLLVMVKIVGPNYFPDVFKLGLNEIRSEFSNAGNLF